MLYAVVRRCPHGDGQPVSFDATAAKTVPGVAAFHMLKNVDHGGRIILPLSYLVDRSWSRRGEGFGAYTYMGQFDTTVLYSVQKIKKRVDEDRVFRDLVASLANRIQT